MKTITFIFWMLLFAVFGSHAKTEEVIQITLTATSHKDSHWRMLQRYAKGNKELLALLKRDKQTIQQMIANGAKRDGRIAGKGPGGKVSLGKSYTYIFVQEPFKVSGKRWIPKIVEVKKAVPDLKPFRQQQKAPAKVAPKKVRAPATKAAEPKKSLIVGVIKWPVEKYNKPKSTTPPLTKATSPLAYAAPGTPAPEATTLNKDQKKQLADLEKVLAAEQAAIEKEKVDAQKRYDESIKAAQAVPKDNRPAPVVPKSEEKVEQQQDVPTTIIDSETQPWSYGKWFLITIVSVWVVIIIYAVAYYLNIVARIYIWLLERGFTTAKKKYDKVKIAADVVQEKYDREYRGLETHLGTIPLTPEYETSRAAIMGMLDRLTDELNKAKSALSEAEKGLAYRKAIIREAYNRMQIAPPLVYA